ncbi:MAG TPA: histidinol-phosphate transaminase [Polyangiaceae bacterium]|nr:histidinol-phosphate transaminase [Polyangiaceae bacterium]
MSQHRFVRDEISAIQGYIPGEQPRDRSYTKLNTNENPYPPSERVLAAIRARVGADLRLYPDPAALALRQAASRVYGSSVESIMAGNGSDELLSVIMRTCIASGDRVTYATPTYSLYDTLVALQGGTAIHAPYPADFALPAEALARASARVTIVCNPNAPSGTRTPLSTIEELARSVSGLLIVDEAYVDFSDGSALGLVGRYSNVVVLRTFSKSFSLCGLRIGLAFAQPTILAEFAKVRDSYSVNQLGLQAATAALEDYGSMQANVQRICASRADLQAGLIQRGFQVLPSETNFVLARRPGVDLSGYQQALKGQGVLVRHFSVPALQDALRITVGTPAELNSLFQAMDALGTGFYTP